MGDLVASLKRATDDCGHALADNMVDVGMDNIQKNTPVETYHLREGYKRTPITYGQVASLGYTSLRWSAYAWSGSVYTEVEYAPFVESGTGLFGPKRKKYKIAPKKPGGVLAFSPYARMPNGGVILDVSGAPRKGGGDIFVRFVMHPGSPGQHMFKIGAEITEHEKERWSAEPLRLWKQAVEAHG